MYDMYDMYIYIMYGSLKRLSCWEVSEWKSTQHELMLWVSWCFLWGNCFRKTHGHNLRKDA